MRLLLRILHILCHLLFIGSLGGHWKQQRAVKSEKAFWSQRDLDLS